MSMPCFKFLILAIIITITIFPLCIYSSKGGKGRRGFGENCNKTMKCSGSAWLICEGGVCSCAKPTEMIYDTNSKKCVSKAGERCRYEIDGSSDMKIFEKSDCISNAICGSDGTCECRGEFYETFNGTCTRRGEHKDDCASDNECRSDMFLKCIDDSCQCDTTQSEFSFQHNHCVGLGGHPCSNGKCTDNAMCQQGVCICPPKSNNNIEFFQHEKGKCVPKKERLEFCKSTNECKQTNIFLSCVDGRCDCDPETANYESIYDSNYGRYENRHECVGLAEQKCNPNRYCVKNSECNGYGNCSCRGSYSPTSTGRCGRNHGERCDSDQVCADAFTCRGQLCTCKTLLQSTYSSGKCRSLAYGPCQTDGDCIDSAECIKSQLEAGVGYCKCKKGFVENINDGCDIEYGLPCPKTGHSCDTLASLECMNRICSCSDLSMLFDPKARQCLGLVGFVCKKKSFSPGDTRNAGALRCVENAICYSAHEKLRGHCKCSEGFSETLERTCTKTLPPEEYEPDLLIPTSGAMPKISAQEPSRETIQIPGNMEDKSKEESASNESSEE